MKHWRHIVLWADYVIFWRGVGDARRAYPLTAERRKRLEALLGDAIEPATDGQSWVWSWNNWNWHNIGERHETE